MKKTLIGFIGDKGVGKTLASSVFEKNGFYKASITSKVREFASHLFSKEALKKNEEEILEQVRKRGINVNVGYWLNLVLISVPEDQDYIVFDDLRADEPVSNKIKLYQILRPDFSQSEVVDIETIMNDGTKDEFTSKIENLCKKIKK